MSDETVNAELNRLLIRIYRGLLQYVGECGPWANAGEAAEEQALRDLVATQQLRLRELADLLTARGWAVEMGAYPSDFSDYHFVALDFLLPLLVADEQEIVTELEKSQVACAAAAEAARMLARLVQSERLAVAKLQSLAAAHPAPA